MDTKLKINEIDEVLSQKYAASFEDVQAVDFDGSSIVNNAKITTSFSYLQTKDGLSPNPYTIDNIPTRYEKVIPLAPYIFNLKPFKRIEHPNYHPDSSKYMAYWEAQEKRCIEGFWGLDQQSDEYTETLEGGWRFMTPQHYWYTRFCFIQDEVESLTGSGTVEDTIQPDIRDIDWFAYYTYITCMGFSGFSDDEEVTCHYLVGRYYKKPSHFSLNPKEKLLWKRIKPYITTKDGYLKKYIDPVEYLKGTFSKPLGTVLYHNPMKNLVELSARGTGKSYRTMSLISHYYNFFGAKTFNEYLHKKKGVTICVGSALSSKSGELLSKFKFSQEQLVDNFGAFGDYDDFVPGFFHKEFAGSLTSGNEKNPYRHEYKQKVNNVWKTRGTRTKIVHQSYESNPEAFVGQRSVFMAEDELGLNDNLLASAGADETVMIRKNKMGWAFKTGTGGNIDKIQQAKEIFSDPESYGYLGFEDKWEHSVKPIGVFNPAYYVDSTFRDENGNQNIFSAYDQEIYERKIRTDSTNTTAIDAYITARPLVSSEIFISPEINIFPTSLLREHRTFLEKSGSFEKLTTVGELIYTNKEETTVKWRTYQDKYLKPITSYDLKKYNGNIKGRIVIFEHPSDGIPDPKYKQSLYKVTYDPVRDDHGGTSLAAIKVHKGIATDDWNNGIKDNIVAEYYGRLDRVEEMHEIAIRLAIYYNAKILPETNIRDFVRYCRRRKKMHLLQVKPNEAISKVLYTHSNKYEFGMDVTTKSMKIHGEQLLKQWLMEIVGRDDNDNPIYRLHKCYSLRLLDELIVYDRKKNTDGISAMFLLMFWKYQEELVPLKKQDLKEKRKKIDIFINSLEYNKKVDKYNPLLR